jgi:hypothetical protein
MISRAGGLTAGDHDVALPQGETPPRCTSSFNTDEPDLAVLSVASAQLRRLATTPP